MQATVIDKIKYLLSKHPEVEKILYNPGWVEKIKNISGEKHIVVTEDEDEWRYYVMRHLIDNPRLSVKEVSMYEVLDIAMGRNEDIQSLTSIKSDILVIHDGVYRSMSHEQKEVMIQTLWESSPIVIYEWLGDYQSFITRSRVPEPLRPKVARVKSRVQEDMI